MRIANIIFILFASLLVFLLISRTYMGQGGGTLTPSPNSTSSTNPSSTQTNNTPAVSVLAENLDTPWGIVFLPDGTMLVTERQGRIRRIDSNGKLDLAPVATIERVKEIGEGGLLGITIHPNFSANNYVYLYYTYSSNGSNTHNRVIRMTYKDNKLTNEQIIVNSIPGASNHNGGRIKFGPDDFLYITTGDAQNPSQAQNTSTLGGKILRVTDEGKTPSGNPFNNLVFSYGHRNVQGLAWDSREQLWATEHGPSGGEFGTGNDELNKIESGKNYGWPIIQGDQTRPGMETPRKNSGPSTTWAPSGASFVGSSLFFTGLRGQTLYEAVINGNQVTTVREHFKGQYGRLRDVVVGPDGMLYMTTSNRDGRGTPVPADDRILRINPVKL